MLLAKTKLDLLRDEIKKCGDWATDEQDNLTVNYKEDNSPVTEVDIAISNRIINLIKTLFPECAIISEEEKTNTIENAPYTFVLDPIDGTDVYSQGLPSYCVSLGIIDSENEPIGAIVYAPRFGRGTRDGLLLTLYPGEDVYLNGKKLEEKKETDRLYQITLSSTLTNKIDFSNYKGKIRIFGSQIIHILSPILFCNIQLSILEPCYIWDYCGAHAIIKKMGYNLYTPQLELFKYSKDFLERKRAESVLYCGKRKAVEEIIKICPLLKPNEMIVHNMKEL